MTPEELERFAKALLESGLERDKVLSLFGELARQYDEAGDEEHYERCLDLVDRLTGWCASHMKL